MDRLRSFSISSFRKSKSIKLFNKIWLAIAAIFIFSTWLTYIVYQLHPELFFFRSYEFCNSYGCRDEAWSGKEKGDLSRDFAFLYQNSWPTEVSFDRFGFRSVPTCSPLPQIIIWGDSYVKGAALSDSETFPWQLSKTINVPTYNGSGGWLGETLAAPHLSDVKIVIEMRVDRSTANAKLFANPLEISSFHGPIKLDADVPNGLGIANPERWHPWFKARRFIQRIWNDLQFIKSHGGSVPEYLYEEWATSDSLIEKTIEGIQQHAAHLKSKGYEYLFILIPSKQAIYGVDDHIEPQPLTLALNDIIMSRLTDLGIRTVDLKRLFQAQKSTHGLFFTTDSHWKPFGVKIAAEAIGAYLRNEGLLTDVPHCQ